MMSGTAYILTPEARVLVEGTIQRHCEIRGWRLNALNPRSNHVHVVVDCQRKASPETAMEQFKAWCTRRLREAGLAGPDQRVWTEHGSTRWLDSPESFAEAVDYVKNQQ
jgi:REP element-mobilizing transposase RayT